ncbi:MAG TPA: ATP synthase F0 subunit B [Planctomycetota bacterium]|nr:ATP synthase F0 subunit B [Planctomycetota bacterium]
MSSLLLAEGGLLKDLGINGWILLVQAIIFLVTFAILRRLLFGRMLGFMTSREAEIDKSVQSIRHDRAELERFTKEHEQHIARIEKEAYDRMQVLLKEGMEARSRISTQAQHVAAAEVKAAVADIVKMKSQALEQLRKDVPAIAQQAVERVLGVPLEGAKGGSR